MLQAVEARAQARRLMLGAIGVVFGDIGTSPLYTIREAFSPAYRLAVADSTVLGVLSMVFWSLTAVVSLKYVLVVMRADNRGEGGIMSLMALAQRHLPLASEAGYAIGLLGIFGAALFFGDAVLTPAISVLSAVEGIEVVAPSLEHWVLPLTVVIITLLFAAQRHGTDVVGRLFGPITLVWFLVIAATGVAGIAADPRVLLAVDPLQAIGFVAADPGHAFLLLGAVVLAVTGAEALYADMGHFGKQPIRRAWAWLVFPALVLNYFGQGALLLDTPAAAANPFYLLVPGWARLPVIVLATLATVIAAQAVISGAFSLARQAAQLGYLPRMKVVHTSEMTVGQVYVPGVNRLLWLAVIIVVVGFGSSSALASAYGVAVTGTMVITTLILYVVIVHAWGQRRPWILLALFALLLVDCAFFAANLVKLADGAWFPLALGVVVFTLMRTWRRGRLLLAQNRGRSGLSREHFLASLLRDPPHRVPGTAVFLSADPRGVPLALLHNLKHNQVLHAHNMFLTIESLDVPHANDDERVLADDLGDGFSAVRLRYGFMEQPDLPAAQRSGLVPGLPRDPQAVTWFANSERIVAVARRGGMATWRDRLFALMQRNAEPATASFGVPGDRLVELGTEVRI